MECWLKLYDSMLHLERQNLGGNIFLHFCYIDIKCFPSFNYHAISIKVEIIGSHCVGLRFLTQLPFGILEICITLY